MPALGLNQSAIDTSATEGFKFKNLLFPVIMRERLSDLCHMLIGFFKGRRIISPVSAISDHSECQEILLGSILKGID